MSGFGEVTNGDKRTQLEQRADAVRSRLEDRLEALDERRDLMVHMARAATRPPISVILLGVAGAAATVLVVRGIRRRRPTAVQRWHSAFQASAPSNLDGDGFFMSALKRAALGFIAAAVQRVGTRGLERLLADAEPAVPTATIPRPRPR
jgi:hypothetical protein